VIAWLVRLFPALMPAVTAIFNPAVLVLIASVAAFAGWQCYQMGAAKLDRYKLAQFEAASVINAKRAGVTAAAQIQYVKVAGIQNAQNQNALAQFQLATAERDQQSANALNEAYRNAFNPATGQIDKNKLISMLASGGAGRQIPGIQSPAC